MHNTCYDFLHSCEGRHKNGQQIYKKMLNVTNYQKRQIKITMRYLSHPVRMAIIKFSKRLLVTMSRNWNSCELLCGNIKLCSHYRKSRFLKKLKIELLHGRTIPVLVIYPPKTDNRISVGYTHFHVHHWIIHSI